jgi:hypothetical protein
MKTQVVSSFNMPTISGHIRKFLLKNQKLTDFIYVKQIAAKNFREALVKLRRERHPMEKIRLHFSLHLRSIPSFILIGNPSDIEFSSSVSILLGDIIRISHQGIFIRAWRDGKYCFFIVTKACNQSS